jgi:hypothetical protein
MPKVNKNGRERQAHFNYTRLLARACLTVKIQRGMMKAVKRATKSSTSSSRYINGITKNVDILKINFIR